MPATKNAMTRYKILDDYTIIYRRTSKSAVLVKGADPRFLNDRVRIYSYLYDRTKSWCTKLIIACSLSAFKKGLLMPNKYFNVLSYVNRFYWLKNRNRVFPKSLDEINSIIAYLDSIVSINRE